MAIFNININSHINEKPTQIGEKQVTVAHGVPFVFAQTTFTETVPPYMDPEGNNPLYIKILELPVTGIIKYNGVAISVNDFFLWTNIHLLTYEPDNGVVTSYISSVKFDISDTGSTLYSDLDTGFIILNVAAKINLPPTIGDNTKTIVNRSVYTFTPANFTTETVPLYNDPEGDSPLNLRIKTLPSSGTLNLLGVVLGVNAIVSFAQITAGSFTYTSSQTNFDAHSVSFQFEIQDAGSGQYGI